MREITLQELNSCIGTFETEKNPAIALATDDSETNGLTIGWLSLGILWRTPIATVYVHKTRYSKHIFDGAEYFSINFLKDEFRTEYGYFGRVSGKDEDKIAKTKLTLSDEAEAPYFRENRVTIICKIVGRSDFDPEHVHPGVAEWYKEEGVHTQYYGEIIKVLVAD